MRLAFFIRMLEVIIRIIFLRFYVIHLIDLFFNRGLSFASRKVMIIRKL